MAELKSERKICVPENISFDSLNLILIAYLKAGADKKAVSYRDASLRSGVHYTLVSANNKFFVSTGFLVEEGSGQFKLTEIGSKYSQMLDWGRLEEAKIQLRQLLQKSSLINVTLDYVSLKKEVTREDLNTKIGSNVHLSRTTRYVSGINALIDMLISAGLLEEKGGKLKRGSEAAKTAEKEKPVDVAQNFPFFSIEPRGMDLDHLFPQVEGKSSRPKGISMPVTLTINVTDATDINKLKQVLRAIREELFADKKSD